MLLCIIVTVDLSASVMVATHRATLLCFGSVTLVALLHSTASVHSFIVRKFFSERLEEIYTI